MEAVKITMTLSELRSLLDQQKDIVIDALRPSAYYNKESTEGQLKSLPIDQDKFKQIGREAHYPDDYTVLCRYLGK